MSQRDISKHMNIGRQRVSDILCGKRTCWNSNKKKKPNKESIKGLPMLEQGLIPPEQTIHAERCVTCGNMVYIPCFACQIRSLKNK